MLSLTLKVVDWTSFASIAVVKPTVKRNSDSIRFQDLSVAAHTNLLAAQKIKMAK